MRRSQISNTQSIVIKLLFLIIVLSSCMTTKNIEKLKESAETFSLEDLQEEQIEKKDNYSYFGIYYPLFGGAGFGSGYFDFSRLGVGFGHVRNNFISFDGTILYNYKFTERDSYGNLVYSEPKPLLSPTTFVNGRIPIIKLQNRILEKVMLLKGDPANKVDYLITPKILYFRTLNLRFGYENEYINTKLYNNNFRVDSKIPLDYDIRVSQLHQIGHLGISFIQKCNYKYIATLGIEKIKGRNFQMNEIYFDLRYSFNSKIAPIESYIKTYDEVSSDYVKETFVTNPENYLSYYPFGIEAGYRGHLSNLNRGFMIYEIKGSLRSGFFESIEDRFYMELRYLFAFDISRPKSNLRL